MKTTAENKAVQMGQGRNADSSIAHTLKPGEQEFSFPQVGITVVASNATEAEKKKNEILKTRGPQVENKEQGEVEEK